MYSLNKKNSTVHETQKLVRAIADVAKWHGVESQKGTCTSNVSHPYGVLALLQMYMVNDEDILIAALFHDCLEETSCTAEWIDKEYGRRVAKIVSAVTETNVTLSWEFRKKHTLDHLKKQSYEIKLVMLADQLHNLISMAEDLRHNGEKMWDKYSRGKAYQRWYYSRLAQEFNSDVILTRHPMVVQFLALVESIFHVPKYAMPRIAKSKTNESEAIAIGEGFITSEIPYTSNTILSGSRVLKTYSLARDAVSNMSKFELMSMMEQEDLLKPVERPIPISFGVEKDEEGLECITMTLTLSEGNKQYCETWDLISWNKDRS